MRLTGGGMSAAQTPEAMPPLRVAASGICCAVGYNAPASIAAIRARLNHFRETDFVDDAGEPLRAAMLYGVPVWGQRRLQHMYRAAIAECLAALPHDPARPFPPVILIGAEHDRGERFVLGMDELLRNNCPEGGYAPDTYRMCLGKAGIADALRMAGEIFSKPGASEYIVIVGIDSFLDAATIDRFLQAQRIRCSTNLDGFIPGEAGAAIALSRRPGKEPSLWIEGLGQSHEPATPEGGIPLLAHGLTQALRQAIENAGAQASDYLFHASGVSGEQWYFKEASLAMDRVMTHKAASFPHRLVCQSVGEIGAACGPLALGWIAREMMPDDVLGHRGLLHFANDNGQRAALALHYRK
jgi:3-oxoacyl-[acyl-carrier-protein] synthase-1